MYATHTFTSKYEWKWLKTNILCSKKISVDKKHYNAKKGYNKSIREYLQLEITKPNTPSNSQLLIQK